MFKGQHEVSQSGLDVLSRVTPIAYLIKQNKKPFTQTFLNTAFCFPCHCCI